MINRTRNESRTDKWFSASIILALTVFITSGSAATVKAQVNATQQDNMTSALVNNTLKEQEKIAQDTANAVPNLANSIPPSQDPFDPFHGGPSSIPPSQDPFDPFNEGK